MVGCFRLKTLVSVIVPAYNEEKNIGRCLDGIYDSYRKVPQWKGAFEIIVCDNNSTDGTANIARKKGANVVFEPINQIARARNRAAERAQGEWLVFIDADTFPTPELFLELAKTLESEDICCGGGRFSMTGIPLGPRLFLLGFSIFSWLMTFPGGGFMFCNREAFQSVNGFDQSLFVAEEISLFLKLKEYSKTNSLRTKMIWSPTIETSPRKLNLYSPREFSKLFWNMLRNWKSTLRNKEACQIWYDGRR